jgi:hypothetical protein
MSLNSGAVKAVAAALFLAVTLSGCIFGRSVVDIQPPASTSTAQGKAFVKITALRHLRQFEVNPSKPSSPSLGEDADVANPAITARAIGRKRNGYGGGAGDVALPEGRTVSDVVRDTVRNVLQDKGYVLVDKESPNYAAAAPLEIDIDRFWSWMVPEGLVVVYFNVTLTMKGDMFLPGAPLEVQVAQTTAILTGDTYRTAIERALGDLATKIGAQIKPPSA